MNNYDQDKRLNTMKDKDILKRLLSYSNPYQNTYVIVLVVLLIVEAIAAYEPTLLGDLVDYIGVKSDDFSIRTLLFYAGAFVFITLSTNLFRYIQTVTLQKTGQSIIYDIRKEIFDFLQRHDIAYLNSTPAGAWVSRVANDTNTLNEMFTSVVSNVVGNIFKIIIIIIYMLIIDYRMALASLMILPFIIIISIIFRRYMRTTYREMRKKVSRVNDFLAEHVSGMKIIQIFNQEKRKEKEFDELSKNLQKSHMSLMKLFAIYRPSMYASYMISVTIIFGVGSYYVTNDLGVTYGTLFTFYIYISRFFDPIQNLAEQFNVLQSAFASSERIFGILDSEKEVVDQKDAVELKEFKGNIEFKDVWFRYVEDEWVLKGVSFKVNAKESVAFVGATGSGKTTILSLIVRNYDIQKGQILIDGVDINNYTIASIRKHIGQMLQDVFLFTGTIKSNINLDDESITDKEILEACKYVNADRFINKLEHGLDEEVRERGNNFSSGERQLISFARTVVHKPSLMILDEATSNIDTETEELIQDSLSKMMNISTMLIVAHRLSTVQHVDRIIVLSKGKILEQGNHQELLQNKGHYYYLYQLQYQE